MSIKKQTLKSKPVCKVTFRIPKEMAPEANEATVVGDFNNWKEEVTPMQKLKSGDFTVTMELSQNQSFQFRYLVNKSVWINDEEADGYIPMPLAKKIQLLTPYEMSNAGTPPAFCFYSNFVPHFLQNRASLSGSR
ncbi:isoamylase early set domain-containing protein [Prolixibacter bellariivorans]|uniref:isoamylase early set domain-containing protein n=1 Tax=Prolixibacter bellariivorans TaxID=314319 RepID=UPI0011DE5820|nr:isoamylase early set domain-containing protein [Prolixibacter bellariivorans]